ncbi:MAG TPA: hypothetical protein PKB02_16750 [Anaerohalosphaeraceae bacterium]|nr:hypothetical protein [Anaerohalosphaeraceae bacterium]
MAEISNSNVLKNETSDIIKETTCSITSGLAAIATSDRKDVILSASRIFQAFVKGKGLEQLQNEWDDLKKKGKIKDDYESTTQHQDCLLELLNFLDNDCPDELRFQTLKKIFLVASTETQSGRNSCLPYEYMKLCRSMSSGEILAMLTAYRLFVEKKANSISDSNFEYNWVAGVTNNGGFEHRELVEMYKRKLLDKNILLGTNFQGSMGKNSSNGLTSLGLALCRYIESYDNQKEG